MHDHGLQRQVDAALSRAIGLTGPEQHQRDCALILDVVRYAYGLNVDTALTLLAQEVLVIGFPHERVGDQTPRDLPLMLSLEAVGDIVAAQPLDDLLSGLLGMTRWVYVCLADGDHAKLRTLAQHIETRARDNDHLCRRAAC